MTWFQIAAVLWLCANTLAVAAPVPTISANGATGTVVVTKSDEIMLTLGLNAASDLGKPADWWMLAVSPFGVYSYHPLTRVWTPGLSAGYQGTLFNIREFPVQVGRIPIGEYDFYFAVDRQMNGILSFGSISAGRVHVAVEDVNRAPVLTAIAGQNVAEGATLRVELTASDADGDHLTYSLVGGPGSVTGNAYSYTPGYDAAAGSPYSVTVRVSDGRGGEDSETFVVAVSDMNHAPVLTALYGQSVAEGTTLRVELTASDADGDNLTYSLVGGPGSVTGSVYSYTPGDDAAEGGPYWATIEVSDGRGCADQDRFMITVTPRVTEDEYLVIDLSGGPNASSYPVSYRTAVPAGGWTDEYKTTKLVLRRIRGGWFTMGSPSNELGRLSDETQHEVSLNADFYMGVFEVTQWQWNQVNGYEHWPSYFNNDSYSDARPVEQVSYNDIRGSIAGAGWPDDGNVDAGTFMGRLRAKTGLPTLDLPTDAQWEYACRAETTTALNSGKNLTGHRSCTNVSEVGRYWYNGGSGYGQNGDTSVGTAKVGSYLPNAWGLYDMHGNVWEWCLDWHATYPGAVNDPRGPASGSSRVFRGGSWGNNAEQCRSARRGEGGPGYRDKYYGFRLSRTLP